MPISRIDVYSDVSDQFEFIEEKLVYVDAPLEGIVRAKTGELFAFRCSPIVAGYLWHWVLLPVESTEAAIDETFAKARKSPPDRWISIVEDRRGDEPRIAVGRLDGGVHSIPQ
jgi:hypothetical protein